MDQEHVAVGDSDATGGGPLYDPAQLLLARPEDKVDALAMAEEALNDGALPYAILEVTMTRRQSLNHSPARTQDRQNRR